MPLCRASQLDRLLACPGSTWMPQADYRSNYAKEAGEWGTDVHAWKETGNLPSGKNGPALQKRIYASQIDRNQLWPADGQHEVAMAYNVVRNIATICRTGDAEYKDRWKAAFDDEWITGTCDFVMDLFGEPWIDDLKTGRKVVWQSYEAQQSLYVLAWGISEYGEATQSRSTLTHWPKYPIPQPPNRFGVTMDLDYLNLFREKLQKLREDILRGRKSPDLSLLSTGEQCTYCPSRGSCPKLADKLKEEDSNGSD